MDTEEEDRIIKMATQADGHFSCPYCMKNLIDRQSFRLHIRLHISKSFVRCDICNQGFEDNDKLQEHMVTHGDQFSCNKCSAIFKTYNERKMHLKTEHETQEMQEETVDILKDIKKESKRSKCKDNDNDDDDDDDAFDDNDKANDNDDEDKQVVERSNVVNGRYECVSIFAIPCGLYTIFSSLSYHSILIGVL